MNALCLLIVATAVAQTPAQTQSQTPAPTGGLKGVVIDSVTHQPVKKASVSVSHVPGRMPNAQMPMTQMPMPQNQGNTLVITDASGSFVFDGIAAGQVQVHAQHTGYPPSRTSKTVEIQPGDSATSITLELVPGAAVTGHVYDEDGDPLLGCRVNPHPAGRLNQGVPLIEVSGSDVDGVYRLAGVPAGKYLLSIDCQRPVFEARPFSAGPDLPPTRAYPSMYFPAALDEKSAEVIELFAGMEKAGVDFRMKPAPVTQVRGTFSGDAWRGQGNLNLQLMNVDSQGPNRFSMGSAINQEKGTFEFRKVFPGSYMLIGFSNGSESGNGVGAFLNVEVKDQPVSTVVEWRHAADVSGTAQLENPGSQTISLNQIMLLLEPVYWAGSAPQSAQVQDDGSFTIKRVLPARWRIRGQGSNVFVKYAWAGTEDITSQPLDLSGGLPGPLRLVLSSNMATIHGTAPAGANISAQEVTDSPFQQQFHTAQADQSGQFQIPNLAPATYRIRMGEFPLDNDDPGKVVTVEEGQTVTVDFKN